MRYGGEEAVRYVAAHGAKLNALNRVKSNAYDQAYYGNKRNIPLIHELGLDVPKHGGSTLRTAVADRTGRRSNGCSTMAPTSISTLATWYIRIKRRH